MRLKTGCVRTVWYLYCPRVLVNARARGNIIKRKHVRIVNSERVSLLENVYSSAVDGSIASLSVRSRPSSRSIKSFLMYFRMDIGKYVASKCVGLCLATYRGLSVR